MFLKLLGSLILFLVTITEKYWSKEIPIKKRYKKAFLFILIFSFLFSVVIVIVDDNSTSSTIENQKASQTELIRKNDSLKYQLDSVLKVINENEKNSGSRNIVLQYKLNELNDKLDPFIKLAIKKYPNMKIEDALAKFEYDLKEQKDKLSTIAEYSEVASYNCIGVTGKVGYGLIESSGISELLKGSYEKKDDKIFFKFDDLSILKYKRVISEYPKFPFSYYVTAMALKEKGDPKWKEYADKAVELLNKTTQIVGHNPNHDEVLKILQQTIKTK
jgi:hypothetical protein